MSIVYFRAANGKLLNVNNRTLLHVEAINANVHHNFTINTSISNSILSWSISPLSYASFESPTYTIKIGSNEPVYLGTTASYNLSEVANNTSIQIIATCTHDQVITKTITYSYDECAHPTIIFTNNGTTLNWGLNPTSVESSEQPTYALTINGTTRYTGTNKSIDFSTISNYFNNVSNSLSIAATCTHNNVISSNLSITKPLYSISYNNDLLTWSATLGADSIDSTTPFTLLINDVEVYSGVSTTYNVSGLSAGTYTAKLIVKNNMGNSFQPITTTFTIEESDDWTTYNDLAGASGNYVRIRFSDPTIDPTTFSAPDGQGGENYVNATWTKMTDTTFNDWIIQTSGSWIYLLYSILTADVDDNIKIIKGNISTSDRSNDPRDTFASCTGITEINNLNITSSYADFTFAHCTNLKIIRNSSITDAGGAVSIQACYAGCTSLTELYNCRWGNLYIIANAFDSCASLKTLPNICSHYTGPNTTDYYTNAFSRCTSAETGLLDNYLNINTHEAVYVFNNCGTNNAAGLAERAQIPTEWGGDLTTPHTTFTISLTRSNDTLSWSINPTSCESDEEITYSLELDGTVHNLNTTKTYDISSLTVGSHTATITATCKHELTATDTLNFSIAEPHHDFTVTLSRNDDVLNWVMSPNTYASTETPTYNLTIDGTSVYTGSNTTYTLSNIAAGSHTIKVTATCAHSNTFNSNQLTYVVEEPHQAFNITINPYSDGDETITWNTTIGS